MATWIRVCKNWIAGDYDALILAEAGLRRRDWKTASRKCCRYGSPCPPWVEAPGPGDPLRRRASRRIVERLDHPPSHSAAVAERAMLAALEEVVWRRSRRGPAWMVIGWFSRARAASGRDGDDRGHAFR